MAGRRPRVRPLEPVWTEHEGESVLVLRDRSGVWEQPLAVQPVIGFILSLCDGSRDEDQIRAELSRELKQVVEPARPPRWPRSRPIAAPRPGRPRWPAASTPVRRAPAGPRSPTTDAATPS